MNSLFLIFIGIPAIEVFFMIKIGGKIGALNTVSLIFLTAIIGIYFAKLEKNPGRVWNVHICYYTAEPYMDL